MKKALSYAIEKNDAKTVESLVEAMITDGHIEELVQKKLEKACKNDQTEIDTIRALLKHVNIEDMSKALNSAVRRDRNDLVKYLLTEEYADVDEVHNSFSPLYIASYHGYKEMCELLIAEGADVDKIPWKTSPLYIATSQGNLAVVELLITEDADVNQPTLWRGGKTALMRAAELGDPDLVNLLIQSGAKLDMTDSRDNSALAYALDNDHAYVAELISEAIEKANPKPKFKMSITIEGPQDKVEAIKARLAELL